MHSWCATASCSEWATISRCRPAVPLRMRRWSRWMLRRAGSGTTGCPAQRRAAASAPGGSKRAAPSGADGEGKGGYLCTGCDAYVTVEPCAMCAGAIVVARIARIVFGASDPRAGACGSVMDVFAHRELNHRPVCLGGVLGEASASRLRGFFRVRR